MAADESRRMSPLVTPVGCAASVESASPPAVVLNHASPYVSSANTPLVTLATGVVVSARIEIPPAAFSTRSPPATSAAVWPAKTPKPPPAPVASEISAVVDTTNDVLVKEWLPVQAMSSAPLWPRGNTYHRQSVSVGSL